MLLLVVLPAMGQQPVYRHITEDDGLPDNEIYYLYQDRKGITWISTNSGLCRYNGLSFQYFSNPQLKAKSTGCIKEDVFGRIWVLNFNGQLFYVQNDSLQLFQLSGPKKISSNAPFVIGPDNELVIASEQNELIIYRPRHTNAKEKPNYYFDTILPKGSINPFFASDGRLWSNVLRGNYPNPGVAVAYSREGAAFFKISGGDTLRNYHTGFVFEHQNQIHYFEREMSTLYKLAGNSFTEDRKLNLAGFKIVVPLKNGQLAFCTNNGLFISDEKKPISKMVVQLFQGQTISAFCEDSKGNLWIGTLSEGIYFIPKLGLKQLIAQQPGLDYSKISTICTGPANQLIIGFLDGELGLLNEKMQYRMLQSANTMASKTQSLFYSPQLQLLNWQNAVNIYQAPFSENTTTLKPGRGIGYATKDMVYIPKWNAALLANPVDIQLMSLDKNPISSKIPPGWISQYDTVTISDKSMPWPHQSLLFSKERGRAVYYDEKKETIWGADKNGITLFREFDKSTILLNGEPIYATNFCAHNELIWTGTFSQGLIAIKDEKVVKQFLIKDGLASNSIYKIRGSGNHLWISTDRGLQYFDLARETFFLVDKSLGLPSYKINEIALVNGLLYISTPKGLLSIPDTVRLEKDASESVYLNGIYCNGQCIDASKTSFDTYENNFIFKVEVPVYGNRRLLRYRYRLKGADRDFTITTTDNAVFEYKSLQSGSYRFELLLTDAKGNTIGPPVYYSFIIKPPFYKTAGFITLCILLLGVAIYWLVKKRISRIKKRGDEKLAVAKLESELKQSQLSGIKAQMNPHFMFNALNSIQEFILLNEKRQANMYMGKFADLMRMTLDMSNKPEVLLEDEIKMLELYLELEALRFEEQFRYSIQVDETVDKTHIHLPAMLIQPNVENAIKHGLLHRQDEKRLSIHFSMKDEYTLYCTVTDNGIGRKRSGEINEQRQKKHTSFATGATQKRLELLNHGKQYPISIVYHDLADKHGSAAGTMVEINIPLQP
jgi:Histidine kinase/Y_Y_Y domain/Two component regulator propeller